MKPNFCPKLLFWFFLIILALILSIFILLPQNKTVNIVFNTDFNYKDYTKVAIKSAIENKNPDTIYVINILCVDLTQKQRDEFNEFQSKNVYVNTIPLNLSSISNIGNYEVSNHVSRADLFKFLIPDIFKDLDKILYIDSDTLILGDLTKLYNTNVSRYYLAAVMHYVGEGEFRKVSADGTVKKYGGRTYNCGVLLYNLKKWRDDDIKTKLIEAKSNDFIRDLVTQRAFNEVMPYDKIKSLPQIYNFYSRTSNKKRQNNEVEAVIVHFAGSLKPWSDPRMEFFGNEWWYYAKLVNPDWQVESK